MKALDPSPPLRFICVRHLGGEMQAFLRRHLPKEMKILLRPAARACDRVVMDAKDLSDRLAGRGDPLAPPRRMWGKVGAKDQNFIDDGRQYSEFLISKSGVDTNAHVLDVGAGIGKFAIPFARFLSPEGRYSGIDVDKESVDWCVRRISSRYGNFKFHWADLKNDRYNDQGKISASDYVFPFEGNEFHLIFLLSVFTHMWIDDAENYLRQISRVIRDDGVAIISTYLINDNRRMLSKDISEFTFSHYKNGSHYDTEDLPEAVIAYDEDDFLSRVKASGLCLSEPIQYGSWHVSKQQHQDLVILRKPSTLI
jgi:SAM-dependent methyltransferase